MSRSMLISRRMRPFVAVLMTCTLCITASGAKKGTITRLTVDPKAPVFEMFDAIETGKIEVRVSMEDSREGRVFFTNKTDKPLTIEIPKSVVAVHMLPQPGMMGPPNNFFGNALGLPNGANGIANGGGMAQGVGGNMQQGQGQQGNNPFQNGNGNGPNPNFFSIPPEKVVQINLNSVCLNYGRPEPNSGLKYKLVKTESVTSDPALQQLLESYSPRTSRDAQQAAAWHLANGMTWEQIANLTTQPLPGVPTPIFSRNDIDSAKQLVKQAQKDAAERPKPQQQPASAVTASIRN